MFTSRENLPLLVNYSVPSRIHFLPLLLWWRGKGEGEDLYEKLNLVFFQQFSSIILVKIYFRHDYITKTSNYISFFISYNSSSKSIQNQFCLWKKFSSHQWVTFPIRKSWQLDVLLHFRKSQ